MVKILRNRTGRCRDPGAPSFMRPAAARRARVNQNTSLQAVRGKRGFSPILLFTIILSSSRTQRDRKKPLTPLTCNNFNNLSLSLASLLPLFLPQSLSPYRTSSQKFSKKVSQSSHLSLTSHLHSDGWSISIKGVRGRGGKKITTEKHVISLPIPTLKLY